MIKFVMAMGALFFLLPSAVIGATPWQQRIAHTLGKPGSEMPGGVYRIGLPRTDLNVALDGVTLRPALALGSWLAFREKDEGVVVMGDLVLTEDEVQPVMKELLAGGIQVTALHNHLLRASPATVYMHVLGRGTPEALATTLHNALAKTKTPIAGPANSGNAKAEFVDLDIEMLDRTIGHVGKVSGGIYHINVPRAEPVNEMGTAVPPGMGTAIALNFQPTGAGSAVATGDFVLAAGEVDPVMKALTENDIDVTALHNHMLDDQPHLFFMHFWAKGDAAKIARGLRAALDEADVR